MNSLTKLSSAGRQGGGDIGSRGDTCGKSITSQMPKSSHFFRVLPRCYQEEPPRPTRRRPGMKNSRLVPLLLRHGVQGIPFFKNTVCFWM
ncbi:hypothetical protein CEXT_479551 [Caerostris extrusa]|uniref:Uncharacterized protein n=1 Tax=Caerostris extrusa TaxID=172846 RepID=A0AAV4MIU6_CAEEX|nr:hypothetical protein CEXT_479551 [Caerostris extrusa]